MTKRFFDLFFSFLALLLFWWFIFACWIIASIDTKSNGLFIQERIGQFGKVFKIYKLRTIKNNIENNISKTGFFFRKTKIDELPQLWNIFIGNMSFVGPRPDIAGYYDTLEGEDKEVLKLKPGLPGLASIKYYNEEEILKTVDNPQLYNDTVIFPDKVKINLEYYKQQSLLLDVKIIFKTLFFKT